MGFLLKKILSVMLLPPVLWLLWIGAGLLLLRRRPRLGHALAWSGLCLSLFFSTWAGVRVLAGPLESVRVLQRGDLDRAQAIVILAGGWRRSMPEYGGPTLNHLGLERLRYGARLARESRLPIVLSGGAASPEEPPEAELMAQSLRADFGIEPGGLEVVSRDTAENAKLSKQLLEPAGTRRIVLVTHAAHMRRAMREFEEQGLEVIPAPTAFLVDTSQPLGLGDFVPNSTAAYAGWYVMHEWLGLLAQELRMALSD